jgi:RNA polymerase sigma factor (sigma-70 family)
MTDQEFDALLAQYKEAISGMARKLARTDTDLFDDLVSVGMIRLWQLDISKATSNADSWIRAAIRNAMVDFIRQQRLSETESLTALLAAGNQVTTDPDTGLPFLVAVSDVTRRKEVEDFLDQTRPNGEEDDR